jgi:hypothetical protein
VFFITGWTGNPAAAPLLLIARHVAELKVV